MKGLDGCLSMKKLRSKMETSPDRSAQQPYSRSGHDTTQHVKGMKNRTPCVSYTEIRKKTTEILATSCILKQLQKEDIQCLCLYPPSFTL